MNKKEYMKAYRLKNKEKIKEQQKEYHKKYYQENKEFLKEKSKKYYETNQEKIKKYREDIKEKKQEYNKEYSKKYRFGEKREELLRKKREYHWKNREEILNKKREYSSRKEVRSSVNEKCKERYNSDVNYKLRSLIRSRINLAIKDKQKSGSAIENLGCSIDELIVYLESKFEDGMNWQNHSRLGWHIDHIVPLSHFDLEDPKQFSKACHYTNLQPLWYNDNLKKSNKLTNEM